jgi:hypothetical protein
MTLTSKTPTQLQAMVDSATAQAQAATAGLYRDGRPLFAPDEHERRVKTIEAERRASVNGVLAETQRRSAEIDEQLQPAEADPMAQLSTEEVQRAAALDTFVAQDVDRVLGGNRPGDVAAFISAARAAARSSDRASKVVFLRRLPEIRPRIGTDRAGEVEALLIELGRPFKSAGDKAAALTATQRDLQRIQHGAVTTNYLQRTYGARR